MINGSNKKKMKEIHYNENASFLFSQVNIESVNF